MNKHLLSSLLGLLCVVATAQTPPEAFTLTNSLPDLWDQGKTEQAVDASLELYRLSPSLFIDRVHHTLSQVIKDGKTTQKGFNYLQGLYLKNNGDVNKVIQPIFLWCKSLRSTDSLEINSILTDLNTLVGDSSAYPSRAARYGLLVLNHLENNGNMLKSAQQTLLRNIIASQERYPYLKQPAAYRYASQERAWYRYMLAYSYHKLYASFDNKPENLAKASDYSPDSYDRQVAYAYFYDAALLTGNPKQSGYKMEYCTYLKNNGQPKEALSLLSEITFCEPTDNNLAALKSAFADIQGNNSFSDYWHAYINTQGKASPKTTFEFPSGKLDLTSKPGKWIYIDVWGTWCQPCVRELPQLQAFYAENSQTNNAPLSIYTFSFNSTNLQAFMDENRYQFPVCEIDQLVNKSFEVSSFPTKILITPEGNYLKIPYGTDWRMHIKNYILM